MPLNDMASSRDGFGHLHLFRDVFNALNSTRGEHGIRLPCRLVLPPTRRLRDMPLCIRNGFNRRRETAVSADDDSAKVENMGENQS